MFDNTNTNAIRAKAALDLLRHKMLLEVGKDTRFPSIDFEDVNEVLIVAGLPVIIPEELQAKEVEVMNFDKEEE